MKRIKSGKIKVLVAKSHLAGSQIWLNLSFFPLEHHGQFG